MVSEVYNVRLSYFLSPDFRLLFALLLSIEPSFRKFHRLCLLSYNNNNNNNNNNNFDFTPDLMIGVLAARKNLRVKNARQPVKRKDVLHV